MYGIDIPEAADDPYVQLPSIFESSHNFYVYPPEVWKRDIRYDGWLIMVNDLTYIYVVLL